eukprot:3798584-Prymnesium_polylepis.1
MDWRAPSEVSSTDSFQVPGWSPAPSVSDAPRGATGRSAVAHGESFWERDSVVTTHSGRDADGSKATRGSIALRRAGCFVCASLPAEQPTALLPVP